MKTYEVHWIGVHNNLPVYSVYYTPYHAEQYAAALRSNGITTVTIKINQPIG